MAWLEADPSGNVHICFRIAGRRFRRSLRTKNQKHAQARQMRLEENLRLVEEGRLEIPVGTDIAKFLLSDGKLSGKVTIASGVRLGDLFDSFFEALPNGNLEESTIRGMEIHRRHLERHLGKALLIQRLTLDDLQRYVAGRSRQRGLRGRNVGANTIRKEIVTFRSVWNWGVDSGKLKGTFPGKGLRLPKESEKPPFQTWMEIEKQIERGGLSSTEMAELWDCLFLNIAEIDELLLHVKKSANLPFIYPMFAMAAHTGARRSELLRAEVSDVRDSDVLIRERKRVRGRRSVRRVPLSLLLREVMTDWLAAHAGGQYLFYQLDVVRSKTRSDLPRQVTRDEANDHFKRTLARSRWRNVRGWHCLRHSFCSNCAMKGVDQRIIDSWVGHTTDAMRRRYRHLFPNCERHAIDNVFGS